MKRELRLPHYQRYMDDLTFFGRSSAELERARDCAAEWLQDRRRLRLKKPEARPKSSGGRFTYLGYRASRAGLAPTRALIAGMRRRIAEAVLSGRRETIERSVASYAGLLKFGSGARLSLTK